MEGGTEGGVVLPLPGSVPLPARCIVGDESGGLRRHGRTLGTEPPSLTQP